MQIIEAGLKAKCQEHYRMEGGGFRGTFLYSNIPCWWRKAGYIKLDSWIFLGSCTCLLTWWHLVLNTSSMGDLAYVADCLAYQFMPFHFNIAHLAARKGLKRPTTNAI